MEDKKEKEIENKVQSVSPEEHFEYTTKRELKRTMTFVLVVSIVFSTLLGGLLGYIASSSFVNNNSSGKTLSSITENVPSVNQQSAVISAVKKTNPAVVSIIASQYVSNNNSFNNIFNFLNNGGSNSSGGGSNSSGGSLQEVAAGSGFIITSDGYILTNKHVVASKTYSYTVIMNNGVNYKATVVARDPTNDLAVVKINATNLPTLTLGNSSNLQLGSDVIAIGNALGQYQNTVDTGVISGLGRTVQAQNPETGAVENLTGMIQTDAEINPGNSGGPLLNLEGQVIGINTAIAQSAQGIGFAIPINQAKADVSSILKNNGKIIKPELGVTYEMVTPGIQKSKNLPYSYGAIIVKSGSNSGVLSNTPASRAGLKTGDVILEVNGVKVNNMNPLSYLIGEQQINSTITLKVYTKNKNVKNFSVTLNKVFS